MTAAPGGRRAAGREAVGMDSPEFTAWCGASDAWAKHVTHDCEPCYVGRSCAEGDRLLAAVVAAWSVVEHRPAAAPASGAAFVERGA